MVPGGNGRKKLRWLSLCIHARGCLHEAIQDVVRVAQQRSVRLCAHNIVDGEGRAERLDAWMRSQEIGVDKARRLPGRRSMGGMLIWSP